MREVGRDHCAISLMTLDDGSIHSLYEYVRSVKGRRSVRMWVCGSVIYSV